MTGPDFCSKLQKIGFSQVGFARKIRQNERTIRNWISGSYPVPTVVAMLINLMIKTNSDKNDLRE